MIDRFQDPEYLYGLIPLWVCLFGLLWWLERDQAKLKSILGERVFQRLVSGLSSTRRRLKLVFQAVVLSFFLLALARPQAGSQTETVRVEGIELLFVVDVSTSMLAEDLKPSRLILAQKELIRLIELLPGHKVGLVAFAGSAYLMSPLTPDLAALRMFIDSLSTDSVSTQGTRFKQALEVAEEAFERGGVGSSERVRVTQAVVLVSDGEDHEPGAIEAVKALREKGIRVFALAAGTEKGGPIPMRDGRGRLMGYKKDRSGQVITSSTNGSILQQLAQEGGGSFRFLTFGGRAMQDLAKEINELQKSNFDENRVVTYSEVYWFFLSLGAFFLVLELFIGESPSDKSRWRGRYI